MAGTAVGGLSTRAREHPRPEDPFRATGAWIWRTAVWMPVVTLFGVLSPLLFTTRSFGHDWTLHLWLTWRQQLNIEHGRVPSYYVSGDYVGPFIFGVFYPVLAFAGGPLYAFGGYLSLLLGGRPVTAYVLMWILAACMAYTGLSWISYHAGLRGWRTQVAGAVYVTGAYALTNMFGRGDFGEYVAVASVPLILAAAWALLIEDTWRLRSLAALVVAVVTFTGSHNITLLWGTVFMALAALTVLLAIRPRREEVITRRVLAVAGVGALGVGVNAWFILPNLAYGTSTIIAEVNRKIGNVAGGLNGLDMLLSPLRATTAVTGRGLTSALPWIPFVWAVVVALMAWRRSTDAIGKRLFVGTVVLGLGFLAFATIGELWVLLPSLFDNTQFAWRLHSYVLLAAALSLTFALRLMPAIPRRVIRNRAVAVLTVILAFGFVVAIAQGWSTESRIIGIGGDRKFPGDRSDIVASVSKTPVSWYAVGDFRDATPPVVKVAEGRLLWIPPEDVLGTSYIGTIDAPPGREPFVTNIGASPAFVEVEGIEVLGRNRDGLMVARRLASSPDEGPVTVSVTRAESAPIVLGTVISVISMVGVLVLLTSVAVAGARRRRERRTGRRRGVSASAAGAPPRSAAPRIDSPAATGHRSRGTRRR